MCAWAFIFCRKALQTMISIVTTSIVSFISTNIDNIFVMMVLYARVDETFKKKYVVIGQYLAIGILTAISLSVCQ